MSLEQVQEWAIKGTGAGQELGSNTSPEEGWNCSLKLPSGRSGREIILKWVLSINWLGMNLGCKPWIPSPSAFKTGWVSKAEGGNGWKWFYESSSMVWLWITGADKVPVTQEWCPSSVSQEPSETPEWRPSTPFALSAPSLQAQGLREDFPKNSMEVLSRVRLLTFFTLFILFLILLWSKPIICRLSSCVTPSTKIPVDINGSPVQVQAEGWGLTSFLPLSWKITIIMMIIFFNPHSRVFFFFELK